MKVKELMEKLSKLNPDDNLFTYYPENMDGPAIFEHLEIQSFERKAGYRDRDYSNETIYATDFGEPEKYEQIEVVSAMGDEEDAW